VLAFIPEIHETNRAATNSLRRSSHFLAEVQDRKFKTPGADALAELLLRPVDRDSGHIVQ
jgi:hypothetical protein